MEARAIKAIARIFFMIHFSFSCDVKILHDTVKENKLLILKARIRISNNDMLITKCRRPYGSEIS